MSEIELGEKIYTNGVRPDFLNDDDSIDVFWKGLELSYYEDHNELVRIRHVCGWDGTEYIRLPIEHPYYQQQKETNMKSWQVNRVDEICAEYAGHKMYTDEQMMEAFAEYVGKHEEEPKELYELLANETDLGPNLLKAALDDLGLELVKKL